MSNILVDNAIVGGMGPRSAEPAFSGALSFMRQRYLKDPSGADIAILGIPFDGATSNRPGARFGPRAVREASAGFDCDQQYPSMGNPFENLDVVDVGDCFIDFSRQHMVPNTITEFVASLIPRCGQIVSIGGDHSITHPIVRAIVANRGPIAIVQFDAHPDLWQDAPDRVSHGSWLSRAANEGLIQCDRCIQIGLRTFVPPGFEIDFISAYDALDLTPFELAEKIRSKVAGAPAYLSFDIDSLDPAYAPGTGTPVAGGISTAFALRTLWHLRDLAWCGMDTVEVSPPFDHGGITALAAATIIQHYIQMASFRKKNGTNLQK